MISESMNDALLGHHTRLIKLLYQGSNVAVFEGSYMGSPAAVKITHLNGTQAPIVERELKSLKALLHPNVLKIYDCFWHCESYGVWMVLITELCKKDFEREVKDRKAGAWFWSEGELWGFLCTLTSVLAFMQRQNIAHRDLKPSNIFLAFDGTIKLGDFGSSKMISQPEGGTLTGTPFYLSPKLRTALVNGWPGIEHDVYRSDVYSLGIVLLTMLKLDTPIRAAFSLSADESFSCELNLLQCSDQLKCVLRGMLAWDENQRFDFIQLEQWLQAAFEVNVTFGGQFTPQFDLQAGPEVEPQPALQKVPPQEILLHLEEESQQLSLLTCAVCRKTSDLKQSKQLFTTTVEGKKFLCCSKGCEDVMKDIKRKRRDFDCPECGEKLPADVCVQVAQFLSNPPDFSVSEMCPYCNEEFLFEDFANSAE